MSSKQSGTGISKSVKGGQMISLFRLCRTAMGQLILPMSLGYQF